MSLTFLTLMLFSFNFAAGKVDALEKKVSGQKEFVVTKILPGTIFEYLGLESDDKIIKINGKVINNLSDIKNDRLDFQSITIIRNGKEKTLQYKIKK